MSLHIKMSARAFLVLFPSPAASSFHSEPPQYNQYNLNIRFCVLIHYNSHFCIK